MNHPTDIATPTPICTENEPAPGPGPVGDEAGDGPRGAAALKERPSPSPTKLDQLPPWRVLLHNADEPTMDYVVATLVELTPLNAHRAVTVMLEAHKTGVALVLVTHKERAELYRDQFQSKRLTVTIEPAE